MSEASTLLEEHRRAPKGLGRMADPSGIGNVGSIVVGRALRWYLQLDAAGTVTDARFQVFNAQEMVPAASLLVSLVQGRSAAEAAAIGVAELCAAHPPVARADLPVVLWPLIGLRLALADAGYAAPVLEPDAEFEALVCRCHGVSQADVRGLVADLQGSDVTSLAAAVVEQSGATTGCGTCQRDLEALVADLVGAKVAETPTAGPGGGMVRGRVALMHRIDRALRPLLDEAAGRVEPWDLRGATLVLRFAAELDERARRGWLERIERELKDEVDPTLGVAEA